MRKRIRDYLDEFTKFAQSYDELSLDEREDRFGYLEGRFPEMPVRHDFANYLHGWKSAAGVDMN